MTRIDTLRAFDGKAHAYAQFRPDYLPQAIEAVLAIAGLGGDSVVADLGAGTGMLTRHFADRVAQVFAVEPNDEMRAVARASLRRFDSVRVLAGTADATGLPDHSVDAVTAGRALQWFDPEPSRRECQRILRPGGWLIVVRTPITDAYSDAAISRLHDEAISRQEPGQRHHQPQADPIDYFGGDNFVRLAYPCEVWETWPEFLGRVQSFSSSPRPDDVNYDAFVRVAREIFDGGAVDGALRLGYATEVLMKQVTAPQTRNPLPLSEAEIESDIVTRFERVAARFPGALAVKAGDEECTYAELDALASRIASLVRHESPSPVKPVALLFDHGIDGIACIMGVLKAGRAYCALSPRHPAQRQRQLLDDLQPALLLYGQSHEGAANELAREGLRCLLADRRVLPETDLRTEGNRAGSRSADAIAAIYYTSGTTGEPKGIALNHRQLLHRAWLSAHRLDIVPGSRVSQIPEIAFVSAASDIVVPLLAGATICPFDAARIGLRQIAQWLHRERIEIVRMPAALFQQFLDALEEGEQFPRVRYLQPAGKLQWPSVERYRRHFARECRLVRQLASTEASLLAMMMVDHDTPRGGDSVPVGYPVPGKELWLESRRGVRVGVGEIGEIVVRSRYLHAGIWGRPETFGAPGEAREHRTGDLARWLEDGSLEFVGRVDARVKIRGFTVDPEQVEAAIGNTGLVADAAVVADDDGSGEPHLAAYAVPLHGRVMPSEIRARLAEHLPDYMVPSRIVLLDGLPLTPNGKVDGAALPRVAPSRRDLRATYVAPRTPTDIAIAAIWEDVLARAPIGIDDDFLDVGGDSLLAARIANRVSSMFHVDLSPRDLFDAATIARMAELVSRRRPDSAAGSPA